MLQSLVSDIRAAGDAAIISLCVGLASREKVWGKRAWRDTRCWQVFSLIFYLSKIRVKNRNLFLVFKQSKNICVLFYLLCDSKFILFCSLV